jgi:hypothetical protein
VSEQRLSIPEATEIVRNRLNVSPDKAQALLWEADAKGKIRVIIDQNAFTEQLTAIQQTQANRQIKQTIGSQQAAVASSAFPNSGSALAVLRESAERGALVLSLRIQLGQVSQDELLSWLNSFGERKLKRAPDARIHQIIWEVYNDPASGGPSYKDLPKYVLPRLKALGFEASGKRIQGIGKADEFKPFRGKVGVKKSTSQAG